ncbi:MAG: hypothetical protein KGJ41_12145 [Rhodospirillales bacterium]|nr:hypothetical protein [Rhodospirillales bacterium]
MPTIRHPRATFLVLAFAPAALFAASSAASARTLEVGPGKSYQQPSAAIAAAQPGDTVSIAAGQYFDCAVIKTDHLTIEGSAPNAAAVLTDKQCAGKGLLVTDGNDITIRNLTLTRVRVPDGNGAGIRAEGRDLTVDHVKFINNQDGILGNDNPGSTIIVRDSFFQRNGTCDAYCAHGIYVGAVKLLRVENSVFTETQHAHNIKSRAALTEVIGCDISDGPEGTSSYQIDIPSGGGLVVRNTKMEKGPKSENHTTAIILGEEGVGQPTPQITITDNTLRNDGTYPTLLVDNLTATPAMLSGNKLIGKVTPLKGDGQVR